VQFRFSGPRVVKALSCNCSICSATGFLHVFVAHEQFELRSGGQDLVEYRFGSGQARHLFCGVCGVKSFYQPRSHRRSWSVNRNCLAPGSWEAGNVSCFDGQNWDDNIGSLHE